MAKLGILEQAQSFIQQIPSSVLSDYRIRNALIHMWVCLNSFLFIVIFSLPKKLI